LSILTVLRHRAIVNRATDTYVKGRPQKVWALVTPALSTIPVLYSKDKAEFDPTWTASQQTDAGQRGTLFAKPDANIKPGDHVTITRPNLGTFEVLPDPASVQTLNTLSHKEYKVRSVN
jgi:hypothetical protein